ncbi:MAG: glycosyltransferase [Gemmatimonadetes bacterium]|nr:glycosyltransferase [Gemmatimonadota bacterium]
MPKSPTPRVAIVHDWLVQPGGAELVLRELIALFPQAELYALIDRMPRAERDALGLGGKRTHTSFLQRAPGVARHYRSYLPLMPLAARSLDVSAYDIVITNSHAVAKGVRTRPGQLHVNYCLSPMRYAWDLREQYLREAGLDAGIKGFGARWLLERMRRWDHRRSADVTTFVTLSHFIAERIKRAYGRDAEVVYPPVDTEYFTPVGESPSGELHGGGFYLTTSRFVPYKRVDMIARAFAQLGDRELVLIGDGPDRAKVLAVGGPNVRFLGQQPRDVVRDHMRRARAFVFAAEEDFGIAPVEAMACGTPVIAYGKGGATETVRADDSPDATGMLYPEQTAESLAAAVRAFEARQTPISAAACRAQALKFRAELFGEGFGAIVAREWAAFAARA